MSFMYKIKKRGTGRGGVQLIENEQTDDKESDSAMNMTNDVIQANSLMQANSLTQKRKAPLHMGKQSKKRKLIDMNKFNQEKFVNSWKTK